jgi:hypothetical protein
MDHGHLKKVNWKDFKNWQFLNLVEGFAHGPLGADTLKEYCGAGLSYSAAFCRKMVF